MRINLKHISIFTIGGMLAFTSCIKSDDSPGYEYMPDMYRSQAIEAYVDYGMVKDDETSEAALARKMTISARKPAEGSIPFKSSDAEAELYMPYSYENTIEGYDSSATNHIPEVFLNDVEGNVKEGKRLYNIMCQHCHGMKGQGDGAVVTKFGFNPPNPYNAGLKDRTLGTIFHVITYGKNAMGSHASQLNKEERWKVAMYVRTLQHDGDFKLEELIQTSDSTKVSDSDSTFVIK
jgi:mono/diheme cytochrome c family protein